MNSFRLFSLPCAMGLIVLAAVNTICTAQEDVDLLLANIALVERTLDHDTEVLKEVEKGAMLLIPSGVHTLDGRFIKIDDYTKLPKEERPRGTVKYQPVEKEDLAKVLAKKQATPEQSERFLERAEAASKVGQNDLRDRITQMRKHLEELQAKAGRPAAAGLERVTVSFSNGRLLSGVKLSEDESTLVMRDDKGVRHEIRKADIEEYAIDPADTEPAVDNEWTRAWKRNAGRNRSRSTPKKSAAASRDDAGGEQPKTATALDGVTTPVPSDPAGVDPESAAIEEEATPGIESDEVDRDLTDREAAAEAGKVLQALQGKWVCVQTYKHGEPIEDFFGLEAIIKGNRLMWIRPDPDGGQTTKEARFTIDPVNRFFDWYDADDGPSKMLYKLEGDSLVWGDNVGRDGRPRSFEKAIWMFSMKRVRPDDQDLAPEKPRAAPTESEPPVDNEVVPDKT